jgi:hypothetical protein
MNRRGFFGLIGKLATVAASMGVSPMLMAPLMEVLGVTIYVKPGESIQKAMNSLPESGGTILLLEGVYPSEPFSVPEHIDHSSVIRIRGVGPETVIGQ